MAQEVEVAVRHDYAIALKPRQRARPYIKTRRGRGRGRRKGGRVAGKGRGKVGGKGRISEFGDA